MSIRMTGLIRSLLIAAIYSALGATMVLIIVFVLYLNGRADLDVWHLAELDEEFNTQSNVKDFAEKALVDGLLERLPAGGHELVVFDINRVADMGPLLSSDPAVALQNLEQDQDRTFTLSVVTNETDNGRAVVARSQPPGSAAITEKTLGLSWPSDLYSLAHVALPFPPDDPVYGGLSPRKSPGVRLGNIALRGERGVLRVSPSDMLRLRWNPFHACLETRVLDFLDLGSGDVTGRAL